ncbi:MAG: RdgB/HAM1 family non-canonical purine NTP pyrophosphatase [Acidimicrobiia bacterium]
MLDRLVVASKNPDKVAEMEAVLLGLGLARRIVRDAEWPDVEETGATLEENALLKARVVAGATGLPALADDTGLEVDALGGGPGVHTGRYAGREATYSDNVDRLLRELEGVEDRSARFRSVIALVRPSGEEVVVEGVLAGRVAYSARGKSGFGYDPVFEVEGRTLGEMGADEKNLRSHRAQALRALAERLGT